MNFDDTDINLLMYVHDGKKGYAAMMCPRCQVMHPCPVTQLCEDLQEARSLLVRQEAVHGDE